MSKSEEVFEMISNWINAYQEDEESQHFDELIEFVDFERLGPRYILDKIQNNDFVLNSIAALRPLVLHKLELQEKLLLLGGRDTQHSVQKCFKDSWQTCADAPEPISRAGVASNTTHVFVFSDWNTGGNIQVYEVA